LRDGETIEDFLKLPLDKILLRWMNYHLKHAKEPQKVKNFSKDVKDGTAYTKLLNQLDNEQNDISGLNDDLEKRCQKVLDGADNVGAVKFLEGPEEIYHGNPKLNVLFTASIYNACPGLEDVDEKEAYAKLINHYLKDDKYCSPPVPLNYRSDDLFRSLDDGIILCKLTNLAQPETVFDREINTWHNKKMDNQEKAQKLTLFMNAAKSLGHDLTDITPASYIKRNKPDILHTLYQLFRDVMLNPIKVENNPSLMKLLVEGEDPTEFNGIPRKHRLLRWMNHVLNDSDYKREVTDFQYDLMDGKAYTYLLNQLDPDNADLSPLTESNRND
jgi:hypothetical protein